MSNFHYETLHIPNEELVVNGVSIQIPEFMEAKVVPKLASKGYKAVQISKYEWNLTKEDAHIHMDWNPKDGSYELSVESATNGTHIIREILLNTPFISEKQWSLTHHRFWLDPDDRTFTLVGNVSTVIKTLNQLGYCYQRGYMTRINHNKLRIFALGRQDFNWLMWPSVIVCHELSKAQIRTIKIRLVMPQDEFKEVERALENLSDTHLLSS